MKTPTCVRLLALALLFILPIAGHTQDSLHQHAAELVDAMHGEQTIAKIMGPLRAQMNGMMANISSQSPMNDAQKKIFAEYHERLQDLTMQMVSWEKLKPVMIDAYAETFTEQELIGLTEFYKSPLGQTLIEKTPTMSMRMMQNMMGRVTEIQPQIKALTEEMTQKLNAAANQ